MGIVELFEDSHILVKGLRKNSYESNMNIYKERYGEVFDELTSRLVEEKQDKEIYNTVALEFVTSVYQAYTKNNKIKSGKLMDINMLMVYFVFPIFQMQDNIDAKLLCDLVRDNWNKQFNTSIDYTTYDRILDGFRTKLFGMF